MPAGRFAPSTTGPAHPGTLLAALLVWLDARSRGARAVLRLEDLDPDRCRPDFAQALVDDLAWLGLTWDAVIVQSARRTAHEAALDHLAATGRLYPCTASRKDLAGGRRAPDGGWAYDNRGRGTPLPVDGWRACPHPLRAWLPEGREDPDDLGGLDLGGCPAALFGDPVVRRRDGAIAYHLACVVDDAAAGIDVVVRGRDIAPSTMVQAALQRLLGLPPVQYRHHLLLLAGTDKHSKRLGSVGGATLRQAYAPAELVGLLAQAAGLRPDPSPCRPAELLADFTWSAVLRDDRAVTWDGTRLHLAPPMPTYHWMTPAAPAALAVVRVPPLPALFDRPLPLPQAARFARLVDAHGRPVDEVVVDHLGDHLLVMTHGGPGVRGAVDDGLASHGLSLTATPPDPWSSLAHPAAVRWRLDHPTDPPPHRWLHQVPRVLITGAANAGKSTLLNAWCGRQRALVSDVPGTTRDLLAATTIVHGWRLRLFDSAGLRTTTDPLERAGQDLVAQARTWADVVVHLVAPDESIPTDSDDLVVLGKADLRPPGPGLRWSIHDPSALDRLGEAVLVRLGLLPSPGP